MSIAHVFPSRKKYRCDVCGAEDFWGPSWSWFGSLLHYEICPEDIPHICSDKCKDAAKSKIKSGEWKLPGVKARGYSARMVSDKSGYGT